MFASGQPGLLAPTGSIGREVPGIGLAAEHLARLKRLVASGPARANLSLTCRTYPKTGQASRAHAHLQTKYDITVTLANGEVITIVAGSSIGTTTTPIQGDDIYVDGETITNSIVSAVESNAANWNGKSIPILG